MGQVVSKSRFKPRALEFFRRVEESGEELVITDHGRAVIRVVPYRERSVATARQKLRGSVRRYERPLDPIGEWDWDALG